MTQGRGSRVSKEQQEKIVRTIAVRLRAVLKALHGHETNISDNGNAEGARAVRFALFDAVYREVESLEENVACSR